MTDTGTTRNPHTAPWLTEDMSRSLDTIRRIDTRGNLYSMDILHDYDTDLCRQVIAPFGLILPGCSAFATFNRENEFLTGRNYDYRHRKNNDPEDAGTGLNVVIHCKPAGKYESIGTADAFWLDGANGSFYQGTLDDGVKDISLAAMLPYVCMDGMNEKGLTVSILSQGVKPGENAVHQKEEGKPSITHTVLMRRMLDECASVEEAVQLARAHNMVAHNNSDYRLFLTDAGGACCALEWRYNTLFVVPTNAATNFFTAFDDGEDRCRDGMVIENCARLTGTFKKYRYGYGGGYYRFNTIVSYLERCIDRKAGEYRTVMSEPEVRDLLRGAAQGVAFGDTSLTQYSVLYNSAEHTQTLWSFGDYSTVFSFDIHGNAISPQVS